MDPLSTKAAGSYVRMTFWRCEAPLHATPISSEVPVFPIKETTPFPRRLSAQGLIAAAANLLIGTRRSERNMACAALYSDHKGSSLRFEQKQCTDATCVCTMYGDKVHKLSIIDHCWQWECEHMCLFQIITTHTLSLGHAVSSPACRPPAPPRHKPTCLYLSLTRHKNLESVRSPCG